MAPYPISLFHEKCFRKTQNSTLLELFDIDNVQLDIGNYTYVTDGGMSLHRAQWNQNDTVHCILRRYITYVKTHFGSDIIVVLEEYDNNSGSTKKTNVFVVQTIKDVAIFL